MFVKQIDEYIASADFLPPSFQLLPRLLLLLDDLEASSEALAELIRMDPGLTANILRVCNSVAFAGSRVHTVQEALLRLGFSEVHRIVMSVIAAPILKNPQKTYAAREADLWSHSLAAAITTQHLRLNSKVAPELAFTAAILHDIGKIVISNVAPNEAKTAFAQARSENVPLFEVERSLLGIDHAEAGARLLQRWGFPSNISLAVQFHHAPESSPSDFQLGACICLANILAYHVEDRVHIPTYVLFPDSAALKEFSYDQSSFEALIEPVRRDFTAVKARFR